MVDHSNIYKRAVYKICPKTEKIIKKYDSITGAAYIHSMSASCIHRVLRGKRKTAGGYKWEYADDLS